MADLDGAAMERLIRSLKDENDALRADVKARQDDAAWFAYRCGLLLGDLDRIRQGAKPRAEDFTDADMSPRSPAGYWPDVVATAARRRFDRAKEARDRGVA